MPSEETVLNRRLRTMTIEEERNVQVSDQVKGLFGPPPVLSTEQPEQFEELFRRMVACLKPRDTVEVIFIRHFVYALWEIERLTRYGTVAIERWYRETSSCGRSKRNCNRHERRTWHGSTRRKIPPSPPTSGDW